MIKIYYRVKKGGRHSEILNLNLRPLKVKKEPMLYVVFEYIYICFGV